MNQATKSGVAIPPDARPASAVDRANLLLDAFDSLDRDETAESWSDAGSIVGELVGMARGEARIAEELRRQVSRLEERVQVLEVREANLINEIMGRRRGNAG